MAALANARHERFAQGLASGLTQAEAYAEAGYEPSEPNASRLRSNDKVSARLAELQERGAVKAETTVETLLQAAWDIINKATASADFTAASSTIERAAKIAGVWVDQSKTTGGSTVVVYGAQPVTADEWAKQFAPPP